MSFGWGAGDIFQAAMLLKAIIKAFTDSTEEYLRAHSLVGDLALYLEQIGHFVLQEDGGISSTMMNESRERLKLSMEHLKQPISDFRHELESVARLQKKDTETMWDYGLRLCTKLRWKAIVWDELQKLQGHTVQHLTVVGQIIGNTSITEVLKRQRDYYLDLTTRIVQLDLKLGHLADPAAVQQEQQNLQTPDYVVRKNVLEVLSRHMLAVDMFPPLFGSVGQGLAQTAHSSISTMLEVDSAIFASRQAASTRSVVRVDRRLTNKVEQWLSFPAPVGGANRLWLRGRQACSLSKIIQDVGNTVECPVIRYECRPRNQQNVFIPPSMQLRNLILTYLYVLFTFEHQNLETKVGGYLGDVEEIARHADAGACSSRSIELLKKILGATGKRRYICIVDNFDLMEDPADEEHGQRVRELIRAMGVVLRKHTTDSTGAHCFLVTTASRRPSVLSKLVSKTEMMSMDTSDDASTGPVFATEIRASLLKNVEIL